MQLLPPGKPQPAPGWYLWVGVPPRLQRLLEQTQLVHFGAWAVTAQNVAEQFYIIFRGLKTLFPKQFISPVFCHKLWNRGKGK